MSTTQVPPGVPVTPSERALAQRRAALLRANMVRMRRAALLRRLVSEPSQGVAVANVAEIITDPPEALAVMHVEGLLLRVRRFTLPIVEQLMSAANVSSTVLLSELDECERVRLVVALQMRATIAKAAV